MDTGRSLFLVERYLASDDQPDPELLVPGATVGDSDVRVVWSLIAPDDAALLVLLEATDAGRLIDAARRAGFAVDRITAVRPAQRSPADGS